MGLNTTLSPVVVMNTAIADTTTHTGTPFLMDYLDETTLIAVNGTNQSITLGTNYSDDGGNTWTPIGTTFALAAGASLVTNQYANDLTGIRVLAGQIQVTAVAAVAPTSGNLKVTLQGMSD